MTYWETVPGLPSVECSTDGTIRLRGRVASGSIHTGYVRIHLPCGKRWFAHQLVAMAFLGKPPDGTEVNHKNGIKTDNRPDNLEYVTRSENVKHAFRTGLKSNKRGAEYHLAKLTETQVLEIRSRPHRGYTETAKEFGVSRACIEAIVYRKTWSHVP